MHLALTWSVFLMAEGSALVYLSPRCGKDSWPCHQHSRYSLWGGAQEVWWSWAPPKSLSAWTPSPLQVRARGPVPLFHSSSLSSPSLVLHWHCQSPAGPPTTQESHRFLHGFAATNEKPRFVLNGLWLWRKSLGMQIHHEWDADGKQMWGCGKSPLHPLRPTLENSFLSLRKADGQGCAQMWEPQLRAQLVCSAVAPSSLSSSFAFLFLWQSYAICLFPHLSSASLCFCLFFCLAVSLCFSHSISLSSCHCLSYPVSCSQTVSDSMSVLDLWISLPHSSWLLPKGSAPTLHAWISLPISLSPQSEE